MSGYSDEQMAKDAKDLTALGEDSAPRKALKELEKEQAPEVVENIDAEEDEPLFGKAIAFNTIFRLKGKKGLWYPITSPNKAKMVGFRELLGTATATVNLKNCQCLNDFVIYKNDGSTIKLSDAFDNLVWLGKSLAVNDIKSVPNDQLMTAICPDYDADRFKDYHAKKIVDWFVEVTTKIDARSK